jgi:hypothetical protein
MNTANPIRTTTRAIVERADDMGTFVPVPNAALRHFPNRISFRLVASAHTMEGNSHNIEKGAGDEGHSRRLPRGQRHNHGTA